MAKKIEPEEKSSDTGISASAMPTKELFIKILTRDIELIPAIVDLVDNCGDGARRLREGRQSLKPFDGLWARLEFDAEKFTISDNCGGISVEIAKKYAFRFGRPHDAPTTKHSVGEFGVGMKRAIFKLGNHFEVESTTLESKFLIDVDINEWAKPEKLWQYDFLVLEEKRFQADQVGTTISVTELHKDISDSFELENFQTQLKEELQTKLQDIISKGLAITLNGIPIDSDPLVLISDKRLAPAYKELRYPEKGATPVKVKLYCGLGKSAETDKAGWHVFCNGRLILEGDKTDVTGWGVKDIGGIDIPGFHGQFNHLRGFAYFDCDDPGKLPWNTTKTGLNTDSAVYRAAKLEMVKLMRPVVNFLNKLSVEKKEEKESGIQGQLTKIVSVSKIAEIDKIETRELFEIPKLTPAKVSSGPAIQRIQYDVTKEKALEAKKTLHATSWKEVGIKTFEYFYNAEIDS